MEPYIPLKTSGEVACIRKSCRIAVETLKFLEGFIKIGVTTGELDRIASAFIRKHGAAPAIDDHFPGSICTSVNQVAAHGIPSKYRLKEGDLLTVDIAVLLDGWCGDAAASFLVGDGDPESRRLYKAARRAVEAGVSAVKTGARLGDIGAAVMREAKLAGCRVIADCVGHGIGRDLHEEPEVSCVGEKGAGLQIVPGMVITVEPALSLGSGLIEVADDGWALITQDNSPVAQFEHTAAVFRDHTEILTSAD